MRINKLIIAAFSVSMLMACKKEGCTDPTATNYDSNAQSDDGSCNYNTVPGGGTTTGPNGEELPIRLSGVESINRVIEDISSDPNVIEYYIDSEWNIDADIIIEAGVRVEMRENGRIVVENNASLDATGTASNKIQILGYDGNAGDWQYIRYHSSNTVNKLIHCNVSDGGGTWQAEGMISLIDNAAVTIQNSTFTNGTGYGIHLNGEEGKLLDFESNHLDNFDKRPLSLYTFEQTGTLDNTTTFGNGNAIQEIRIHGYHYTNSVTVPKLNLPYFLATSFDINGGHTSFSPGIDLIMGQGTSIEVDDQGSLSFDGTATDSINVYGASGIEGYWESIVLKTLDTDNVFSHTNFNYGGGTWNHDATVYLGGGALAMDNCTIKNGSAAAVSGDGNGSFTDNGGNSWSDCNGGGGYLP